MQLVPPLAAADELSNQISSVGWFLDRYGLPLALLTFIGVMLWYVLKKIFKDGGVADKIVARASSFLDKIENCTERQTTSLEGHHTFAVKACNDTKEQLDKISTQQVRLRSAALEACDFLAVTYPQHADIIHRIQRALTDT